MLEPLILTRPLAQAQSWAAALAEHGVATHCLPLIETQALSAVQADARARVGAADWVFFTSPAAVAALFDGGAPWHWPAGRRATCVGPGTAAALRAAGVPAPLLLSPSPDAGLFDSEQLWPLLQAAEHWPGRRLLWLCGEGGRDWLIEQLRGAGAAVEPLSIYRRVRPEPNAALLRERLAAPALWLFSSSEAIANLQALAPDTPWPAVQALATHPRIVDRAQGLGMQCSLVSPLIEAVAAAWRAWHAGSRPLPRMSP